MLCVVAAERESAQGIIKNLQKSGLYEGWNFAACCDAGELERWSREAVDVLVLSRFLPGEDPVRLLGRLRVMFPTSHIVLLAGNPSEQQRAYIRAAQRAGLYNIVTGRLPGDRPYTIFVAMQHPKEPGEGVLDDVNLDEEPYSEKEAPAEKEPSVVKEPGEDQRDVKSALEEIVRKGIKKDDAEIIKDKLQEIINMLSGGSGAEEALQSLAPIWKSSAYRSKGILVLSAANKGGVGKTTVAVTLGVALARAGVPTVLVDYDLGAPDVANLLGITGVSGIEALAGRPVKQNIIKDLLVQKENLDVLPGPMNKTLPNFKPGQLLEIADVLTEMYPVVIGDTPPEYWTKPWLAELFGRADYVLAVVDQSVLSERDTKSYAPYLLSMGVTPEKIGIVLNRYSPKLHNPRAVEKIFCSGFKKEVKNLPKVVAVIPEDWNAHVLKGYKGEVAGLEDVHSQWHRLAEKIAGMAGYGYRQGEKKERKTLKDLLFKKKSLDNPLPFR